MDVSRVFNWSHKCLLFEHMLVVVLVDDDLELNTWKLDWLWNTAIGGNIFGSRIVVKNL